MVVVEDDNVLLCLMFVWDGGRRSGSVCFHDICRLKPPSRSTNPSHLQICQPRQPNTSDSGAFTLCSFQYELYLK
jgi:hypothetical protein